MLVWTFILERTVVVCPHSTHTQNRSSEQGALALAEQWTIFRNGRGKLMKTLNFIARTAPSSAFGTFSPRKKPRGEKDSRRRESPVIQADREICGLTVRLPR